MTPREIAEKYVYEKHSDLTDKKQIKDKVEEISKVISRIIFFTEALDEMIEKDKKEKSEEMTVSISPCGYDEVHDVWYKCLSCGSEYILESMKYCPDCGGKIDSP